MIWRWWEPKHWDRLAELCRQDGLALTDKELRDAAEGYMERGADGGGNRFGIVGTVVALNVDRVTKEARS